MKQVSLSLNFLTNTVCKLVSLEEIGRVGSWFELKSLLAPCCYEGSNGRPPFSLKALQYTHFSQYWFNLSDLAIEGAFVDTPLNYQFPWIEELSRFTEESTILRFGKSQSPRHQLERHKLVEQTLPSASAALAGEGLLLKQGSVIDATLVVASSLAKIRGHVCDPEMQSRKKGEQMYFGMKVYIGSDAELSLGHTMCRTPVNVHDILQGKRALHDQELIAFGDAGYQGNEKRSNAKSNVTRFIVMRQGERKALNRDNVADALIDKAEKIKVGLRVKVEYSFRAIKSQYGFMKVSYRGLEKNTQQLFALFALSNFWMVT